MKAHIVTVVIIDFNGLGSDGIRTELEAARFANDCIYPHVESIQTFNVGDWEDDHPLNQHNTNMLAWLLEHGNLING